MAEWQHKPERERPISIKGKGLISQPNYKRYLIKVLFKKNNLL